MYTLTKDFHFEAAHQLVGLPADHPCSNLHGHSYIVRIELQGSQLNDVGFVQDYRELKPIKEWIDSELDHKFLNDVFKIQTSAENMARFIYYRFKPEFPFISKVSISETKKTWASYE